MISPGSSGHDDLCSPRPQTSQTGHPPGRSGFMRTLARLCLHSPLPHHKSCVIPCSPGADPHLQMLPISRHVTPSIVLMQTSPVQIGLLFKAQAASPLSSLMDKTHPHAPALPQHAAHRQTCTAALCMLTGVIKITLAGASPSSRL